jgi:alpha-tubulin suppressor-like RCC1 family protein
MSESNYVITSDYSIYGTGNNDYGQLGIGNYDTSRNVLTTMINMTGLEPVQMSEGYRFVIILMSDGSIYGIGSNQQGELGINSYDTSRNVLTQMINTTGKKPISVSCGSQFTMVLMSDGSIYGTGNNQYGQLGIGSYTSPIYVLTQMVGATGKIPVSISSNYLQTMVLMSDGSVFATGDNTFSKLGLGLVPSPSRTNVIRQMVNNTGKLAVAISTGQNHTMVIMSDGSIYGVGRSEPLGINDGSSRKTILTPITSITGKLAIRTSCGFQSTILLMSDGSMYAAGFNTVGELGLGNNNITNVFTMTATNIVGKKNVNISTGNYFTNLLTSDGYIFATGYNEYGQLGIGISGYDSSSNLFLYMTINGTTPISYVINAVNSNPVPFRHLVIVQENGTIYGAGSNSYGQLGNNNYSYNTLITITKPLVLIPQVISYGTYHTVILFSDGSIYGTGNNQYGQLGIGNNTSQNALVQMSITSGLRPRTVSCGDLHTMVLMSDGSIYGTGDNQYGQLGNGNTISQNVLIPLINTTGQIPNSISCGDNYTIVLMKNGSIYGTGNNDYGQLGIGNMNNQNTLTLMLNNTGLIPSSISCGKNHTVILMTTGDIYGVGYNVYGELGIANNTSQSSLILMINSTGKNPIAVSCGSNHTIVLMEDGSIYGTGCNIYGELGLGNNNNQNILTLILNTTGKIPTAISCGIHFTIVLMSDSTIYGIGVNINGELSTGDNINRNTLTPITMDGVTPITNINMIRGYPIQTQVYYTPTQLTFNTNYTIVYTDLFFLTIPDHLYYLKTSGNTIVSSYFAEDVSTNYYFINTNFNSYGIKYLSVVDASNGNAMINNDISLNVVEYTPTLFDISTNYTFTYIDVSNVTIPEHLYYLRSNISGNQSISSYFPPDISTNYYFVNTRFDTLGTQYLSIVDATNGNTLVSTSDISVNVVPSPFYTPPQYVVNGNAFVFNYTSYSQPTTVGHQYRLINSNHGNSILANFTANTVSNNYTFGDGVSSVIINDLSVNVLSILDASNNTSIANQTIQLVSYTPYYTPTAVDINRTFTLEYIDLFNPPINAHVYYLIDLPTMTLISTFIADLSSNTYIFNDLSFSTITTKTFKIYDFTAQTIVIQPIVIEITPLPYYTPTVPIEQDILFTLFFHSYSIPMIPGHFYQLINTSDNNLVLSTISSSTTTYDYIFTNSINEVHIHNIGNNVLSIFDFTTGQIIYNEAIEIEIIAPLPTEVACNKPKYFGYVNRDSRITCSNILYNKVETAGNNPRISNRMRYSQIVQKKG